MHICLKVRIPDCKRTWQKIGRRQIWKSGSLGGSRGHELDLLWFIKTTQQWAFLTIISSFWVPARTCSFGTIIRWASFPWVKAPGCAEGPTLQMELAAERHLRGYFLKSQKILLPLIQIIADGSLNIPLLCMIKKQNPWGKLATASTEQLEQSPGRVQITINLCFFFFFCINMQRLGQALGTNSTTQDASVGKACLPCLRPCTRTAFKSEGTICSTIPPMTGKSRKSTFSACQWTPYGVWFLTPPLSNSCTYSFFFFLQPHCKAFGI